jgi:hypothetical protein
VCGTVAYLSPEACNTMDRKTPGYVGLPADCWSAGVLMFIMLASASIFLRPCAQRSSPGVAATIRLTAGSGRGTRILTSSAAIHSSKRTPHDTPTRMSFRPVRRRQSRTTRQRCGGSASARARSISTRMSGLACETVRRELSLTSDPSLDGGCDFLKPPWRGGLTRLAYSEGPRSRLARTVPDGALYN